MHKLFSKVKEKLSWITQHNNPYSFCEAGWQHRCVSKKNKQLQDLDLSGIHRTPEVSVRGDQHLLTEWKTSALGCCLQHCWYSSTWCCSTLISDRSNIWKPLKNLFTPVQEMLLSRQNPSTYFATLSLRAAAKLLLCCNRQAVCSAFRTAFCTWNASIVSWAWVHGKTTQPQPHWQNSPKLLMKQSAPRCYLPLLPYQPWRTKGPTLMDSSWL